MKHLLLIASIFCPFFLHAQKDPIPSKFPSDQRSEVRSYKLHYDPRHLNKNGFIVDIEIIYQFINCFGELHLALTRNDESMTSSSYYYDGEVYTAAELGMADNNQHFEKRRFFTGIGHMTTKIVSGYQEWGKMDMTNIIDFEIGGCIGQAFPIVEFINKQDDRNLTDQGIMDFIKSNLNNLDATEFTVTDAYTRDDEVETRIKELKKKKEYGEYITAGDNALKNKNYEEAESDYQLASTLRPYENYPKQKYNEAKFQHTVATGDSYAKSGNKTEARSSYKEALLLIPGDPKVIAKLNALGKDELGDNLDVLIKALNKLNYCKPDDEGYTASQNLYSAKDGWYKSRAYHTYWTNFNQNITARTDGKNLIIDYTDKFDARNEYDDGGTDYKPLNIITHYSIPLKDIMFVGYYVNSDDAPGICGTNKIGSLTINTRNKFISSKDYPLQNSNSETELATSAYFVIDANEADKILNAIENAVRSAGGNVKISRE